MRFRKFFLIFFVLQLALTACAESGVIAPENQNPGPTPIVVRILNLDAVSIAIPTPTLVVLPPVATPALIPTPTATSIAPSSPAEPQSSPSPTCINQAEFIRHLTVSDNTQLEAGQAFAKIWQVKNVGTCPWDTGYSLKFFSGESMSGPTEIALPHEVAPGETIDLRVDLIAPLEMASYAGYWVLSDSQGNQFGFGQTADQPIGVVITVKPTPKPSPG